MTRGGRRTSGGNLRGGGNSTTRSGSGRRDPAWDHGVRVEGPNPDSSYVYVKCNYCPQTITGGINRFKNHLACNHDNARPCPNVPPEVKTEMINFLKVREDRKNMRHENFDFLVSRGSYYQGGQGPHEEVCSGGGRGTSGSGSGRGPSGEGGSSHAGYDRYPYGPMDRYMSYGDVEEHEDPSSERKLTPVNEKEQRRQLCKEIGRFFIDNSIPFNAAASPSFVSMVNAIIRHRRPFKPPSPYELRTWILMEEVKTVDAEVKKVRETWPSTGVTIMSDGWKDIRGRQLINFLVNSPEGTVFLKSVDASDAIKDADLMYKMLEEVVLDVGPENVVQIVTDNASNYKAAGKKLMAEYPTLYWTPCAAHCIDLMLGDLFKLPQLSNAYRNGKKLITFIYNHGWVLALMRKFTKKDLRPAATRFGTAYLTLHSIFQNRAGLEQMFTSTAWLHSSWAKKDDGKAVRRIILRDSNFWPSVVYALKVTRPLIRVLRIVDADAPSMGYLYGSMDRAKEEVANNLDNDLSKYSEIWSIIDKRWDDQLHRHLHAAAYYLNPQFFYEPNFSSHGEIQSGLYACMDKMILDKAEHTRVDLELDSYREKKGMLGRPSALETRHSRTPIAWWNAYGGDVPALKKFAIRVLGLTCTSSACERNWSTFNQVHTKKRNRLSQSRLNALVYVMYNKRLGKKRQLRNMKVDASTTDDDALEKDEWESDDEWVQPPSSIQHEVVIGDEEHEQGDGDGSHVTDPEPCPQWHEVIQNELDEEAIMAEIEAQVQDGGRKRKKKAASASGSGLTRRGGELSLDRGGRSNPSLDRGRGARGKGKGKSTFIVDEDEEDFVDVDEAEDEEEDSFEELMGDDD